MDTYIVTAKVFFEVEAAEQADAITLVEDAIKRARFAVGHKMVSARCVENDKTIEERDRREKA